jgi:hydroxymethylbilane synthase
MRDRWRDVSRGDRRSDRNLFSVSPMSPTLHLPAKLTIATRESALALWQAEHVRGSLRRLYPSCAIELLGLTTHGDRILDVPLADIGGKGLFIKELEQAMQDGRADLAVHSLKDMPMDMPPGFTLAAIMAREDPRDAFVSNTHRSFAELPAGSVVGTSSLRREAQLRERYPELKVEALRGNVNTRLRKLDEGRYAAIILAAAGLKRLGLASRIGALLDPVDSLPAVGQGALAIECRTDRADVIAALAALSDQETTFAVIAERAFGKSLGGDCHTPIAALATRRDGLLWLRGLIASRDGHQVLRGERVATVATAAQAAELGDALGAEFLTRGAARILDR